MARLRRLLGIFWGASLAAEMEYRLNFVIALMSAAGNLVGGLFGLWLLFRRQVTLGGWSFDEALLVFGMFTLLKGFAAVLLTPNLGRIVRHVQQGTLDFVLIKPVDSQLWLSTRDLSLWGIPDLILGLGVLGVAAARLELAAVDLACAVVPVGCALVLLYSLWFMLGATSIWFVRVANVTEVLRRALEAGRFPRDAFPGGWQLIFTFVVPVAFMTTVPAEVMLGRARGLWVLGSIGLAALAFLASRRFWRFALRFYTSASS